MDSHTLNTEKQDLSFVVRAIGTDLAHTQVRLITSANADMLFHYWKVGHFILYHQQQKGWGSKVIDTLSEAIRAEYPDKKGYSRRNIFYMCQFAKSYPLAILEQLNKADKALATPSAESVLAETRTLNQIVQQAVALIQNTNNQTNTITQQAVAPFAEVRLFPKI